MKNILNPLKKYNKNIHNNTSSEEEPLRIIFLLLIILISWLAMHLIKAKEADAEEIQEGIANEIIRFHVIANSDSKEDQLLKYKVRDSLVDELSPQLKNTKDIHGARKIVLNQLEDIQALATDIVKSEGYDYPVSVSLQPTYFPMKVYGEYTFPPGNYEALRVCIGEAKGQNWWCVMFPPLCFVDETYSIIDEESEEQLKTLLTEEEFESIKSKKLPVKIKFKLWELIKDFFQW
ncbi:MAG TPA: stage II sporulation protein R [Clostridiales bacterium]|jgi:stage II sporulation protein R|nr:stage II sporulation protein R [Clostridiales bacterium]